MKSNKFTLLEMLVVCGILLFLMGSFFVAVYLVYPQYEKWRGKSELQMIENGIFAYNYSLQAFPPDYRSSTLNEPNLSAIKPRWSTYIFTTGNRANLDKYLIGKSLDDRPYAVYTYKHYPSGWTYYGVAVWSWGDDIGGTIPSSYMPDSHKDAGGGDGGYTCQNKQRMAFSDFPPSFGCIGGSFIKFVENNIDGTLVLPNGKQPIFKEYMCGLDYFDCTQHDASSGDYSCGWHNQKSEKWEGWKGRGKNYVESAKALYDALGRPMKGRMRNGEPVDSRFIDAKPFLDTTRVSLVKTSAPPMVDICTGKTFTEDFASQMIFGQGVFDIKDSYAIYDPWNKPYFYTTTATEFVISNELDKKPYQTIWGSVTTITTMNNNGFDLFPAQFNKNTFDLGSSGPDGKFTNWIAFDLKFESAKGYEEDTERIGSSIYGYIDRDSDGEVISTSSYYSNQKPPPTLLEMDYDNDNIVNWTIKN